MSPTREAVKHYIKNRGEAPYKLSSRTDVVGEGSASGAIATLAQRHRIADGEPEAVGRIVGPEAMKFAGWQRLDAEYAKQFGIESSNQ